jgi:PTH1 family peptidyl-tRNA hydrolase
MAGIQLVVGLGNPGPTYQATRHNAGAWFVEALANAHHIPLRPEKRFRSLFAEITLPSGKVFLLFPQTYMNLSGEAVQSAAHYFKIPPQHILIAHDELDFPTGTTKLKLGGGDSGHNGLKNIIEKLGTKEFWRLRLGIHRPPELHQQSVSDYVLNKPNGLERAEIQTAIEKSLAICDFLYAGAFDNAMKKLHS